MGKFKCVDDEALKSMTILNQIFPEPPEIRHLHIIVCWLPPTQGTKLASWCLKNLGDYLKKAQLLGIVYLSNVAEKF